MTREIKFRGKRIDNGEWVYGDLLCQSIFTLISGEKVNTGTFWIGEQNGLIKVDPKTVGQFTRFKDKNGKEIYKGDILQAHFPGTFVMEMDNYDLLNTLSKNLYSVEIIGNIYSNPELVK